MLTEHRGPVEFMPAPTLQPSLFGGSPLRCNPLTAPPQALDADSSVRFQAGWLEGSQALYDRLVEELPWRAMERPMYDRMVPVPRLICTIDPRSLDGDHPLLAITAALENALSGRFVAIGANFYRDGNDSVAWHRDSFKRSQRPSTVALVSLGSPRTLAVRRHRKSASKTAETTRTTAATPLRWRLGHGDLFVMQGRCQHDWEHGVPKERGVGPRISLAFRCQHQLRGSTSMTRRGANIVG